MSFWKRLRGAIRIACGDCPNCGSDGSKFFTCDVCQSTPPTLMRAWSRAQWADLWQRFVRYG